MRTYLLQYLLALFFLLSTSPAITGEARATPVNIYHSVKIIDGDTFDATDGNIRFRVRIAGMDAPERGTPFSKLATIELGKRIDGKKLEIKSIGRGIDRYHRTLGQVLVDGHDIGIEMIEMGLATYYRPGCMDYPANKKSYDYDPRPYIAAEERARVKKLYLWSSPKTILPCKVRKTSSSNEAFQKE